MEHMNKYFLMAVILIMAGIQPLKADSPLTSTTFYTAYLEHEVVANAAQTSQMDGKTLDFLINPAERLDIKMAIINALGWVKSEKMAPVLLNALSERYKHSDINRFSSADITCYAYMLALDDYFNISEASELIDRARSLETGSATVLMIWALIKGQEMMDYSWCDVWMKTSEALRNTVEPRDMKTAAIQSIVDYTILYKEYCY